MMRILLTFIALVFYSSVSYSIDLIDDKESEFVVSELNEFYEQFTNQRFVLFQHRANYMIPASYNNKPNNAPFDANLDPALLDERGEFVQPLESEFQISFKILFNKDILGTGLDGFVGYTHRAWWQLYNGSWSKPFRETNYSPEIFARKVYDDPKKFLGMYVSGYDFGFVHESNGQTNELSRSWDRLFLRAMWGTNKFRLITSVWFRIPESSRRDQNSDILDFKGLGELEFIYQPNNNEFRLIVIPGFKRSGAELSYSYPIRRDLRLFTKINYGYGQSLIDYDHKVQRIGVGFTIADPISSYFQRLTNDKKSKAELKKEFFNVKIEDNEKQPDEDKTEKEGDKKEASE